MKILMFRTGDMRILQLFTTICEVFQRKKLRIVWLFESDFLQIQIPQIITWLFLIFIDFLGYSFVAELSSLIA